jgi:DNA-binding NarL/FixJ family response regulator
VPLRCLIVDDNAAFLEASRALLEGQGVTVIAVAATAAEGLRLVRELQPDLILVDIVLGADSGFALARRLADGVAPAGSRVILISTHPEDDFADLVADSPVAGFLAKGELSRRAIEKVLSRG